jgi:hypothetical protein
MKTSATSRSRGQDLADRTLSIAPEWRDRNPRRPNTHGWVAFEVLRRAQGGTLSLEEYDRRLYDPELEILQLAAAVKGKVNDFQDLRHIRCDIYRRCVIVTPRLPLEWYQRSRCSAGTGISSPDPVPLLAEEVPEYFEGTVRRISINAYERDPAARQACIAAKGTCCAVCDFSFADTYGEIGRGYIHVHHLTPLAMIGREYSVDPIEDLVPVCANCHAMLHRQTPPFAVEELRSRLPLKSLHTG